MGMMDMPYAGSKAMLKRGDRWIVSNYVEEIQEAQREKPMRDFCKGKYKWTDENFD